LEKEGIQMVEIEYFTSKLKSSFGKGGVVRSTGGFINGYLIHLL
jgi:hypothetical protein